MLAGIHWLGHDSFRIDGSATVYIDPWKLPASSPAADLILVTHEHHDHFSPPDIGSIAGPGTTVVGPAAVTGQVRDLATVTLAAGESATVGGAAVSALPAYNIDKFRAPGEPYHPREADGLGFIVELDGRRIYHAGDTDAIPEMRGVSCDVALLPVGGTYTMTADEAASVCEWLAADVVVPMHYGAVAGSAADAERLRQLCRREVAILPLERG
jgi:L-ascorbate metabolism protein UlaG (beta-lactamase superfamily)